MALLPEVRTLLEATVTELQNAGEVPTRAALQSYYDIFRDRFGPDVLANLGGPRLLEATHDLSNRDSLVYWLEFKNDEEFPAIFGSIKGGSALKFGVYRQAGTGVWITGTNQKQQEISESEAVVIAHEHRAQLLAAHELLEALPIGATDDAYVALQQQLDAKCPALSDLAWAHKVLSLWHPDKLDDYHVEAYQRFHLINLQQLPVQASGRFVNAGRYVEIARDLGVPMNHLTSALNSLQGKPRQYWRIGTRSGSDGTSYWQEMRDGGFAAIGFDALGDLGEWVFGEGHRNELKAVVAEVYPDKTPQVVGRIAAQVLRFVRSSRRMHSCIDEGDIVVACDGATVLGVGYAEGDYVYESSSAFPHRRPVRWVDFTPWELPQHEGLRTTCTRLHSYDENLVAIERRLFQASSGVAPSTAGDATPTSLSPLDGTLARIARVLERKGQLILYGPPGTGKTWWARSAARELAARKAFGQPWSALSTQQRHAVEGTDESLVWMCTFHPAYGYEDFLEGYRPQNIDGQMVFTMRDGLFVRICELAQRHPETSVYLIIDEINRGDVPRIFGELLTALELDKRGQGVRLPLTGRSLRVPPNLFVVATMNTADRSIALLDTALRRRFGFIELMPAPELLDSVVIEGIGLGLWLRALNGRILEHVGRDARNLQVGHAYLMHEGRPISQISRLSRVIQEDLVPLLEEYCYEDYRTLGAILGRRLVDVDEQRIRHELFEPGRRDELVQALWEICAELATTPVAVAVMEEPVDEDEDDPEDDA